MRGPGELLCFDSSLPRPRDSGARAERNGERAVDGAVGAARLEAEPEERVQDDIVSAQPFAAAAERESRAGVERRALAGGGSRVYGVSGQLRVRHPQQLPAGKSSRRTSAPRDGECEQQCPLARRRAPSEVVANALR